MSLDRLFFKRANAHHALVHCGLCLHDRTSSYRSFIYIYIYILQFYIVILYRSSISQSCILVLYISQFYIVVLYILYSSIYIVQFYIYCIVLYISYSSISYFLISQFYSSSSISQFCIIVFLYRGTLLYRGSISQFYIIVLYRSSISQFYSWNCIADY